MDAPDAPPAVEEAPEAPPLDLSASPGEATGSEPAAVSPPRGVEGESALEPSVDEMEGTVLSIVKSVHGSFGREVDAMNFVPIVARVMELVEDMPRASGPQKKALATRVISRLVDLIPADAPGHALVVPVVRSLIPGVVDTLVAAAKGQLNFGKAATETKKCCAAWFPCCGKPETS